jgi:lipid II:glycine glycyltransferase (peptidoglycan interpeptide bridge formation enzyme)
MSTPATIARDLHEATAEELADWDAHTVDAPGGDVYQSRAWAEYRARHGWQPTFGVFPDGFRVLALVRSWPVVGGAGAYVSRGPLALNETVEQTAARVIVLSRWLARRGVDVVSADPEIAAGQGFEDRLARAGFRLIEEIQPARHRMAVDLTGKDEESLLAGLHSTTRRWIRDAQKADLRVVRYDRRLEGDADPGEGFERPADSEPEAVQAAFARLHDILVETAARRSFGLGAREPFLDWCRTGFEAGHIVLLETRHPDGEPLGAAMFYRHGRRLTFSHGGDRAATRDRVRGVAHLQQWRGLQLALREARTEMDLGGVDVPGLRRQPHEGEAMYGLWRFKDALGARWIEQAGNHEWVARPWRYAIGRVALRLVGTRRDG